MSPHRSQRRRRPANPATRSLRDAVLLIAVVAIGSTVHVTIDRPARAERVPGTDRAIERVLRSVEWPEAAPPEAAGDPTAEHRRETPAAPVLERRRPALPTGAIRRTI